MDAARVKEIVFKALDELSAQGWADFYKSSINEKLMVAMAAEREGYKDLPWCGADTRSIVGCRCGAHMFCKYRCGELESGKAHCAFPDDEPAASEPDTERDRHWQDRAEFYENLLDNRLDAALALLDDLRSQTDTTSSRILRGYLEQVEKTVTRLATTIDRVDAQGAKLENHLRLHKKQEDDQLDKTMEGG